ncbi:uncharacterized protein BKA78DRAFT_164375 [Phyllosticta capitalensis]|uniref:uncharacterized protein n=1 Tax=Phyllosticta capitalensis TaxID=121624 RepID=UPI0031323474
MIGVGVGCRVVDRAPVFYGDGQRKTGCGASAASPCRASLSFILHPPPLSLCVCSITLFSSFSSPFHLANRHNASSVIVTFAVLPQSVSICPIHVPPPRPAFLSHLLPLTADRQDAASKLLVFPREEHGTTCCLFRGDRSVPSRGRPSSLPVRSSSRFIALSKRCSPQFHNSTRDGTTAAGYQRCPLACMHNDNDRALLQRAP